MGCTLRDETSRTGAAKDHSGSWLTLAGTPLRVAASGIATRGEALSAERMLALLASGATNREIATTLTVTLATVKSHLVHVYAKLGVRNRHEALSRAVGLGLLT